MSKLPNDPVRCEKCNAWERLELPEGVTVAADKVRGKCHLAPVVLALPAPKFAIDGKTVEAMTVLPSTCWRITFAHEWCVEFEPADEPPTSGSVGPL